MVLESNSSVLRWPPGSARPTVQFSPEAPGSVVFRRPLVEKTCKCCCLTVSVRCCQMNDVLLYTYPQQDGKYRLKNLLPLAGLKVTTLIWSRRSESAAGCRLFNGRPLGSLQVSRPSVENVQYALKIEGAEITITLSARWDTQD